LIMVRKWSTTGVERKYTGKKWSAGMALLLVYWLVMTGMTINAGMYYERTRNVTKSETI